MSRPGTTAAPSLAVVLGLMMGLTSLAPFTVGSLAPLLVDDLDLSHSQLGSVVSVVFAVAALGALGVGRLVDRFGGRSVLVIALVAVAAGLGVMAAAPSYVFLLAGAVLGGVGLASANPTTNKIVAVHVSAARRGLVMGIKQSGVQIGAFVVAAALPPIAAGLGWRAAIAIAAAAVVAGVAVSIAAIPADAPADAMPSEAGGTSIPAELRWLVLYGFLMGCGIGVVQTYLPLYAHEEAGMSVGTAGTVLSAVSITAVPFGIGYARTSGRFASVATPLGLVAAAAIIPALALLAASHERVWLVWAAAVGLGATAVAWNATGMLAIVSEVGSRLAGRVSGAVVVGFYSGFVAAPVLFGLAVDGTGTYAYGWTGMAVIYAAASLAAASAARSKAQQPGGVVERHGA